MDKQEQAQQEERGAQYQAPEPVNHWIDGYEERMRKHIQFALEYEANFGHGAPGHLDLITIATLARHLSFAVDAEPPYQSTALPGLLRSAVEVKIDPSKPPDASKRPKGMA